MARKHETWSMIRQLHRCLTLPWMCTRDFNKILLSHETLGLGSRQENLMKAFIDVLDECELMDLGYVGHKFTWKAKCLGSDRPKMY